MIVKIKQFSMGNEKKNYQFINARTDNVIGYFSVPANESGKRLIKKLEKKRDELAVKMGQYFGQIYWRKQDLA